MWSNFPTLGWSSMIIKPQITHTRLRCRGTRMSDLYMGPIFVGAIMLATALTAALASEPWWLQPVLQAAFIVVFMGPFIGRPWLGNPEVRVDAAGLTIENVWRTHRVAWRDVERMDLAGYAGITVKTRDQEILCAGLRCSAVEWLPLGRDSRRRARWELERVRTWLEQCRVEASAAARFADDPRA
jgi:Bacterial PH domain